MGWPCGAPLGRGQAARQYSLASPPPHLPHPARTAPAPAPVEWLSEAEPPLLPCASQRDCRAAARGACREEASCATVQPSLPSSHTPRTLLHPTPPARRFSMSACSVRVRRSGLLRGPPCGSLECELSTQPGSDGFRVILLLIISLVPITARHLTAPALLQVPERLAEAAATPWRRTRPRQGLIEPAGTWEHRSDRPWASPGGEQQLAPPPRPLTPALHHRLKPRRARARASRRPTTARIHAHGSDWCRPRRHLHRQRRLPCLLPTLLAPPCAKSPIRRRFSLRGDNAPRVRRVGRRRFASIPGYGTGTAAAVAAVADAAAHATRAHPPFDHKWVKVVGGLRILPLLVLRPDCAAQTGRACLGGVPSRASAASAPISSGSTIACYHACILQPPDAAPWDHALWSRA